MTTRSRFACGCVVAGLFVPVTAASSHAQTLPRWTAHTTLSAFLNSEKTRIAGLPLNTFAPLTNTEVVAASHALTWLMAGSLDGLSTLEALGYDAYTFSPSNGQQYYLLYEPRRTGFRGLGVVVINRAPTTNVVIHAKHIAGDSESHTTSRLFFEDLGAVALVWTGVRRCNSSVVSPCVIVSGYSPCGAERISDASRFNRNVITAATLAGIARDAVMLDIHSNGSEPRHVVMSTGGPNVASEPLDFFPNRVRDRLLATTAITAASCDHPDEQTDAFHYCSRFVQQKICNGLTADEACGPMLPSYTSGRYVQVELRSTVYRSTVNTRAVIAAFRSELR
jgi:hypothetical protein